MAAAVSQNGWPANIATSVSSRLVPGTEVALTVRIGASGDLLLEVAALFDQRVQDIDNARGALDDWGYASRPIRGSTTGLSNHASGTAIDLNATRWPLGSDPSVNLTPAQIATVRAICAATGGVVRWGGDYTGRKDPMHFEINDGHTEADCARALTQLQAWATPTPRGENVLSNHRVTGTGTLRLICPVGKASEITARAWVSATVDGPAAGSARVWIQNDGGGMSDKQWSIPFTDGRSARPGLELPDGATQVNVQYAFPAGGTICLETLGK